MVVVARRRVRVCEGVSCCGRCKPCAAAAASSCCYYSRRGAPPVWCRARRRCWCSREVREVLRPVRRVALVVGGGACVPDRAGGFVVALELVAHASPPAHFENRCCSDVFFGWRWIDFGVGTEHVHTRFAGCSNCCSRKDRRRSKEERLESGAAVLLHSLVIDGTASSPLLM